MIGHKTHTRYKLGRAVGSTPVWGDTWYENEVLENMPTRYVNYNKYFSNVYLGDSNSPNTPTTEGLHGVMIGYAELSDLNSANGDSWEYDFTSNVVVTTRRLLKITITQPNTFVKEINIPDVSRATIPDNEALAVTLGDVVYLLVEMVFELKRSTTSSLNILAYDSSAPYTQGALKRNIPINRILYRVYNQSLPPKDNYGVLSNQTLQPVGLYTQNINGLTVSNLPQPNFIGHCNISAGTEWDGEHPWIGANIIAGQLDNSYAISFIDIRLNIEMILDLGPSPVNFRLYGGGLRILMDAPLDNTFIEPETFPAPMRFVGYSGYGLEIIANRGKFTTTAFTAIRNNVWDGTPVLLPTSYESNALYSAEFTCIGPFTFTSRPASSAQNWLRRIDSWGGLTYNGLKLRDSFLQSIPVTLPPGLTNLDNTFELSYIVYITQQIQQWNTSTVTSFDSTFANLFSVDNDLDLSGWNVSNATSMRKMFYGWPQNTIVAVTGLNNWDVSKVTDMSDMFNPNRFDAGDNLRNIPIENQGVNVIANWNTSAVTNFDRMFKNTRSDLILNIRDWCVSNINTPPAEFAPEGTYLGNVDNQPIWGFCPKTDIIVEVDSGTFTLETTDATKGQQVKLDGMWYDIESLSYPITVTSKKNIGIRMGTSTSGTEVTLSGTAPRRILSLAKQPTNNNAGAVIKFGGCTNLTVCLPDLPTWITSTSGMFEGCTALVSTGIRTTSQVTNMASMFHGCTNFDGIGLSVWNVSNVTNMSNLFNGVTNVTFNPDLSTWNVASVTNMSNMFRGVSNFGSVSSWNVANVTNFSYMFAECPNFNQGINGWNMANAVTLEGMFYNATSFNQPLNGWNTIKVTNMASVFQGAVSFNQPLNNWKFALVTTMADMFNGAELFNQTLHYIDTSAVTNMDRMFKGAIAFNQDIALWCVYNITSVPVEFALNCPTPLELQPMWGYYPGRDFIVKTKPTTDLKMVLFDGESYRVGLGSWVNVSGPHYSTASYTLTPNATFPANSTISIKINTRVSNSQIFYKAEGLHEIVSMAPLYNYGTILNFSQATGLQIVSGRLNYYLRDLSSMFTECRQLTEVKFKITNLITKTRLMFNYCTALTTIPDNWDMSAVVDMSYMVAQCTNFNNPAVSNWVLAPNVKIEGVFLGCSSFNQNVNNWNVGSTTSFREVFQNCKNFNQPLNNWNVGSSTSFVLTFSGCTNFNQNIDSWNMSNAVDLTQMFEGCTNFNQPLNSWNVSKVTTPFALFSGCKNFNQPLNNWNTGAFTTLRQTFENCSAFNQPLNAWDTSKVNNMQAMFNGCTAFNGDISTWNVASVTTMSSMFQNCTNFNQPLNGWNTIKVNNMQAMFNGCTAFNGDISTWNVASVTNMSNMFGRCVNFNQPLNTWNTSKVDNMLGMFSGCTVFNQPLNNWNTGSVTSFQSMFKNCTNFNQNIDSWNTVKVSEMLYMFNGCTNFNQPLNSWNVAANKNFNSMFDGATSFNQPLNNWNMSAAQYLSYMFNNATNFKQDLYAWRSTIFTKVNSMPSNFLTGSRLQTWDTPWSDGLVPTFKIFLDSKYYPADNNWWYELDVYYEGGKVARSSTNNTVLTEAVTNTIRYKNFTSTQRPPEEFTLFTNRREIGAPPTKLIINGVNLLEVRGWEYELDSTDLIAISFKNSPNLTKVPATLRSDLTNLESVLENCPNMVSDITGWNTSAVTNLKNAFKNNPNFNQDISIWNVGSVQNFYGMLEGCTNFNRPIGVWNTVSATLMTALFKNTVNFNQDISNWEVGSVTNMDEMFLNVSNYNHDLSLWCVTNIPSLPTDFATGSNFPTSYYPQWGSCMFRGFNKDTDLVLEHGGTGNIDIYLYSGDKYTYDSVTTTVTVNGVVSFTSGGVYILDILPRYGLKIPINGAGLKRVINWPYEKDIGIGFTFNGANNLIYVPAYLPVYVKDCVQMFEGCTNFNRDIGTWYTPLITSMQSMFKNCSLFNQDIGQWSVDNVTSMDYMLDNAINFNQDLSQWCVTNIASEPTDFNLNGILTGGQKPAWGTCPVPGNWTNIITKLRAIYAKGESIEIPLTISSTDAAVIVSSKIISGVLPTGLTLTANVLTGTITTDGTYNFTVEVTDDKDRTSTKQFSVQVAGTLYLNTQFDTNVDKVDGTWSLGTGNSLVSSVSRKNGLKTLQFGDGTNVATSVATLSKLPPSSIWNGNYTICGWIKRHTTLIGSRVWKYGDVGSDTDRDSYQFLSQYEAQWYRNSNGTIQNLSGTYAGTSDLMDEWIHVAEVRKNNTAYLFIHGELVASIGLSASVSVDRSFLLGGLRANGEMIYTDPLWIDEIKIYSGVGLWTTNYDINLEW